MQKGSNNIVLKIVGFFSVVIYWGIVIFLLANSASIIDSNISINFFVLVIPVTSYIVAKVKSKTDPKRRSLYKGITLGLVVCLIVGIVSLIVLPLILIGSCFKMFV